MNNPSTKKNKLVILKGKTGAVNDLLNENVHFRALWGGAGTLPLNDVKKKVFANLGFSGSLTDMEIQYWNSL